MSQLVAQSQLSQLPASQLPATQELDDSTFVLFPSQPDESVWGRLYPRKPFLKTIELRSGCSYTFGRGTECSEQFRAEGFNSQLDGSFQYLSSVQFEIGRRWMCSGSEAAFLKDFSSNGTYVNGKKVGKNQTLILSHNDTISLVWPHFEVYTYSDVKVTEHSDIPIEVRKDYAIGLGLGCGAQGKVFQCFHKATANVCAVKQVSKKDNSNVLNEVHILSKLKHNHIVRMMGHIDSPSSVFIIMEFMAGDLAKLLQERSRLEEFESKIIFHQVTQAVEYLHNNRIIHRDLKPENILLLSEDSLYIKITDFGLSKHNTTQTCPDTLCGTPAYLAPEVLSVQNFGPYDAQVDVWSMGVILFRCLSGTLPFQNHPSIPRSELICTGRYNFCAKAWEVCSEESKQLVRKMLTVDPIERILISNIYKHPWISKDTELEEGLKELYHSTNE